MIYSKKLETHIPVNIQTRNHYVSGFGNFTRYTVKDNKITVGIVDIQDLPKGINVMYIENRNPELYSEFGSTADQIEVEHCLKRGLQNFEITSEAALNSHAKHYLRGKRFFSEKINQIVQSVIETTPKGQKFNTKFLGNVKMFMPQELIKKHIELIKKHPILK